MNQLQTYIQTVKEDMLTLKNIPQDHHPKGYTFGDTIEKIELYDRQAVNLLLTAFPPCKVYKHKDGWTAYYPTDKPEKESASLTVTEVNPVRLVCSGLDHYEYTLVWFTYSEEARSYFKIKVMIDYGKELITIRYKYNDSRSLPKYSGFKAYPIPGLIAYMYYDDSGEYMTRYECNVEDITDTHFFVTAR